MARQVCLIDGCGAYAKKGARVCGTHLHPAALQAEIQRLRDSSIDAWVVVRYRPMRSLLETVAELERRAYPLKAAGIEAVARSRSHNITDGIATIGDHIATPGTAVASHSDAGRLGAALSRVADCAREVAAIADPNQRGLRDRRCGARRCPAPNRRQDSDARYCAFCGRQLNDKEAVNA